jgi:hypothetical protein
MPRKTKAELASWRRFAQKPLDDIEKSFEDAAFALCGASIGAGMAAYGAGQVGDDASAAGLREIQHGAVAASSICLGFLADFEGREIRKTRKKPVYAAMWKEFQAAKDRGDDAAATKVLDRFLKIAARRSVRQHQEFQRRLAKGKLF